MRNSHKNQRKTWLRRKPKLLLVLTVILISAWILALMHVLRSSEIYGIALAKAKNNKILSNYIGKPIDPGILIVGRTVFWAPEGSGYISFSVSGPRGKASISGTAEKEHGRWRFLMLDAVLKDGTRIDLMLNPQ